VGIGYPFFLRNINSYFFSLIIFLLKGLVVSDARIKRFIDLNIMRLIDANTYIGLRHKLCLPCHGQRTRSNANTQRSKKTKRMDDKIEVSKFRSNKKKKIVKKNVKNKKKR
jgi:ribosomal protein S13